MFRYRVRPGYGSDKLLVEFMHDSTDSMFLDTLRTLFVASGIKSVHKEDLIFLFRTVMTSPAGSFEIDHDEWSMVWAHADENQAAIHFLDGILAASGHFQKEEVDFSRYTQTDVDTATANERQSMQKKQNA